MNDEKKTNSYEYATKCPIVYAMELVGAKWKMPILWNLSQEDALHYNELKRRINGITNTMLTKCLRDLEHDNLLTRYSYETIPPSVTYHLTDIGKELIPALNGIYAWGQKHQALQRQNSCSDTMPNSDLYSH